MIKQLYSAGRVDFEDAGIPHVQSTNPSNDCLMRHVREMNLFLTRGTLRHCQPQVYFGRESAKGEGAHSTRLLIQLQLYVGITRGDDCKTNDACVPSVIF
jgi:hypothetical protein